jgi:hypothetical protein
MKTMPAKQLLREYANLQERLCGALFEQYPVDDIHLLTDLPKRGQLPLGDELWEFERHGSGVRFTHVLTKAIVDAHTSPVAYPAGVDAWRLIEHLESKGIETLTHGSTEFAVTSKRPLERMIEQLSREGLLEVADAKRRIYSLRPVG